MTRSPDAGAAARRLAAFWLVVLVALAAWGMIAGRSPMTEATRGTSHVMLFARRPNAAILSLWLDWDAPAGRTTWAVRLRSPAAGAGPGGFRR